MNKSYQVQTGGYPLKGERLAEQEAAYSIFNCLGEIAGDKAIIKGCEVQGAITTDGFVYIDGEVFEFRGGQTQANVRILEENVDRAFQNGDVKTVYKIRYVTFASGAGSIPWSQFRRPLSLMLLTDMMNSVVGDLGQAITKLETIEEGAQVNEQAFLMKGSYVIGDINDTDNIKTVTFPTVGTSNYLVVGSIVSQGANWNDDNDVLWTIKNKTSSSFQLLLHETAAIYQNIRFQYALIPL
ncbi:hypothetical protein [Corallibacter sp.]|uniref:hypothetical protein n=1 Tax=Corallibacter sp. TaxID=2038084 RepID=UPI003A933A59